MFVRNRLPRSACLFAKMPSLKPLSLKSPSRMASTKATGMLTLQPLLPAKPSFFALSMSPVLPSSLSSLLVANATALIHISVTRLLYYARHRTGEVINIEVREGWEWRGALGGVDGFDGVRKDDLLDFGTKDHLAVYHVSIGEK